MLTRSSSSCQEWSLLPARLLTRSTVVKEARVSHGTLDRDLSLYKKAAEFLANIAAEKTKEIEAVAAWDQEMNGNEDQGIKTLEVQDEDPLDYWGHQTLCGDYCSCTTITLHHPLLPSNIMCIGKDIQLGWILATELFSQHQACKPRV